MPAPLSLRIKEQYMAKRASGINQQLAADAVGISLRSAQRIDRGDLQARALQQQCPRRWRTRADPLSAVWDSVLVPMLEKTPQLEPQTLLLHLEQTFPDQEWYRRKRTLQRRVEQWKALHGPALGVMFMQHHQLFHFRLPYSGWCHVEVIHGGESFVALAEALQNALEACGGVAAEHRTDSLSACYRNRDGSYAGDYTSRYRELCAHLGVIATRNNRGVAHENGAIEGPHRHWKHRLEQQLLQRGSREFETEGEYRQLVAQVSATLNNRDEVKGRLEIEQLHLQPLPIERFADYDPMVVRVRSTSTIEVRHVTYSVPSRLIGQQLTVHLRHDRLDLFLRSHAIETLPRLHGQKGQKALRRIDFRHVIESLRRKPRALLRAQLQDDLLPGESWRQLWRQLLAALPQLQIPEHQLSSYDELLGAATEPAGTGECPADPAEAAETGAVPQPVAGSGGAGTSRRLDTSQLPLRAGGAGAPAAAPGAAAAVVA